MVCFKIILLGSKHEHDILTAGTYDLVVYGSVRQSKGHVGLWLVYGVDLVTNDTVWTLFFNKGGGIALEFIFSSANVVNGTSTLSKLNISSVAGGAYPGHLAFH